MSLTRRALTVGCSAAIAAMAGGRVGGLAFAKPGAPAARDMLVVIFLRGGCDGLGLVAPVDDPHYAAARPRDLRLSAGGDQAGLRLGGALAGGDFRLHPLAGGLKELYDSGDLAIVHACGLQSATRSHFEAMDLIERGRTTAGQPAASGWISRHLDAVGARGLLPAVAAAASQPLSLMASSALAIPDPASFGLPGHWRYGPQQQQALRALYSGQAPLEQSARRTLAAIDTLAQRIPRGDDGSALAYEPEHGAEYPADDAVAELSSALQSVARLARLDVGLQVATVDFGGWDTHEGQANTFPALVDGLSRALSAFYNDMARYRERLTVVVMSEFGRRLKANESGGTDHGHGNLMLLLGGAVSGGRMYGRWPGLAAEQLDDGDLAITTDYRAVLAELLERRLGNRRADLVFPGLAAYRPLGLFGPGHQSNSSSQGM